MKRILEKPLYVTLLAILCNVLWGSAYPAIKIGYELFNITDNVFDKLAFAGIRFIIAGTMVLILSALLNRKFPLIKRKAIPYAAAMAVIYTAVQYIFFYVGLSHTTGTNGSIVNSTQTFFAVILAHFIYKDDKLNARKIIGSVLGFSGVLLVTLSDGSAGFSLNGEGFILIAAMAFVLGSVISKAAAKNDNPMNITGYNLFFGGVILAVSGFIGGGRLGAMSAAGMLNILYLAFLSAAAFTLWTLLLRYNPIGRISIYNFIIPVSGTILSALFLGERVWELKYLISLALVAAGIIIVNRKQN